MGPKGALSLPHFAPVAIARQFDTIRNLGLLLSQYCPRWYSSSGTGVESIVKELVKLGKGVVEHVPKRHC